MLPIHILAGGLAIVFGGLALASPKGRWMHRRAGLVFVIAMLVMGASASYLALRDGNQMNLTAGLMTAYFVMTALATLKPPTPAWRAVTAAAIAVATFLVTKMIIAGVAIWHQPGHVSGGVPFFMPFFLATVIALGVLGDMRAWRGRLTGSTRLARHLWRMCFALFIAAGSFFSIRRRVAAVLPEPLTAPFWRALPIVLIFGAMFYWLWRVRRRPPPVRAASTDVQ